MRIGYYLGHLSLTGGSKVVDQHLRHLQESGYAPRLYYRHKETDWRFAVPPTCIVDPREVQGEVDAMVVTRINESVPFTRMEGLRTVMFAQRSEREDMAHYYRTKARTPRYAHPAGKLFLKAKFMLQRRRMAAQYARCHHIWTPSFVCMQEIATVYKASATFIRNAIDLDLYSAQPRTHAPDCTTILNVADHALGRKNVDTVYAAVAQLREQGCPVRLIRVTPGNITEAERALGLADEFHVQVDDATMAQLYAQADILVSASGSEGVGMPPLEAMASGCLAVLSNIPAHSLYHRVAPDVPGPYALYFDPDSAESLAGQLKYCMESPTQVAECIANGHTLAHKYSPQMQRNDLLQAVQALEAKGD